MEQSISPVLDLLGEENVTKLKEGIVEILLDRVRDDLEAWGRYVFYPPDYSEFIEKCVKEAEKKLRRVYVDKLVENGIKKLEAFNEKT